MANENNCGCIAYAIIITLMSFIPILVVGHDDNTTKAELRIAIPVREFEEWVRVERDPLTGEQQISGFAVEVFKAVVNKGLATPIPYKLIPFVTADGDTMNGTFDDMLKAVFDQDYDGAVGEISILHYRTRWVDFTLPYMDTQIVMLIRRHEQLLTKNGGISLASATKYIVIATLAFSFVVALLFWFLEYRNVKNASSLKITTSLGPHIRKNNDEWQSDMLVSMTQTRLVMILFFMILLVLTACYSASQTSFLTTQSRNGKFNDLNQLIRKGSNVGYRKGSYLQNILLEKGFSQSKLIHIDSDKHMTEMLGKGTANGGVDAIVADSVNLKMFASKYCNSFTIVPTVNLHAAGFGFAFRKGSPLVNEFSEGLLRVIDDGDLGRIQDRTIGSFDTCENDPNNHLLLDNDSLWILIAGAIAVLLLTVIILLLYCGFKCKNNTRKNRVVAYPCYFFPCC